MEIAVIGAGYVGLTTAACLCEVGHRVRLVEVNAARVELLKQGGCPIYEPGLPELLTRHLGDRLTVTDSLSEGVVGAPITFICVGTPPTPSGAPDLTALRRLLLDLRRLPVRSGQIIVIKSTVPPGTNRWAAERLGDRFDVVSNPEFLREGTAVHDFFHPDRIIVGGENREAAAAVGSLYGITDVPVLVTGWEDAELIKYANNAFLAVKVSFANEIAAICDELGASAGSVLEGVGLDARIGPRFLQPGPGYGGSCLPKDVQGLMWRAKQAGVSLDLIPAAERANHRQRVRLVTKVHQGLGSLEGKVIAVWGLAFKAGTDDVRGASSLEIIPRLVAAGATVQAHDPAAMASFQQAYGRPEGDALVLVKDHWKALDGADALVILTEWDLYRKAQLEAVRGLLSGDLVVDGRNLFSPGAARAAGLRYAGVGERA